MKPLNYAEIRRRIFQKDVSLPQALIRAAGSEKSHRFITNPAALACHVFLVEYLKNLAETEFSAEGQIRILDWGCGKGHVSYLLKQAFPQAKITSCDVSGELAKSDSTFGQKTPIITAFKIHIVPLTHEYRLPFADESFDIVLSSGVLEHVSNDQASLHEINRVLDVRGLFFCTFLPYVYSWTQKVAHWMGDGYHDRLYDRKVVDHLLYNSNFEVIDFWHRALFPKNDTRLPFHYQVEILDQWLCENTPLRHLATNVEFMARKKDNK